MRPGAVWLALSISLSGGDATAQQATLRGVVADSATGYGIAAVRVVVRGLQAVRAATTDMDGRFAIQAIPPGTYAVTLRRVGYRASQLDAVRVPRSGVSVVWNLTALGVPLDPVVVSASRTEQAALDAPVAVSVIDRRDIQERIALNPIEYARDAPGVDFARKGLMQYTFSFRGSNSANSGDVLVLNDYRYAAVPSINLNVPYLIPAGGEDVERIEILRGPGAALYGPGAPRGVLHVLTRSPFESPGVTGVVTFGGRSVIGGAARVAHVLSSAIAVKVSAEGFSGAEWPVTDSVEQANRFTAIRNTPRRDTVLIGRRERLVERVAAEARVDWRPALGTELVTTVGVAQAIRAIDLAPAVGAIQGRNWRYSFAQVRARHGRWAANALYNWSDAGETYLLRSGDRLVDDSRVLVGQVQHGSTAGPVEVLYGADTRWTDPRTAGTIHGANEDDDLVFEVGGYVHAVAPVAPAVDVIGAARVDHHSRLNDLVASPRVGVVVKPGPTHAVRITYNRAFTSPDANDLFLDIRADRITLPGGFAYDIRAVGVPKEGFTFRRNCGGLCMRSPFNIGRTFAFLPADATVLWPVLVAFAQLQGFDLTAVPPPTAADVSSRIAVLDLNRGFVDVDPSAITDIAGEGRTITNTFELGYKGVWAGRVAIAADLWVNRVSDLAGAVFAGTPNVFFEEESLRQYLARFLPAAEAALLADTVAALPVGTISPQETPHYTAILLLNRRGGAYWLWGGDLDLEIRSTNRLSVQGSVSFTSEHTIPDVEAVGTVILNIPRVKGSVGLVYRREGGLHAAVRARAVSDFPVVSGVLSGRVESYTVVDARIGFPMPWWDRAHVQFELLNVFDEVHAEFVGAPATGRFLLGRARLEL